MDQPHGVQVGIGGGSRATQPGDFAGGSRSTGGGQRLRRLAVPGRRAVLGRVEPVSAEPGGAADSLDTQRHGGRAHPSGWPGVLELPPGGSVWAPAPGAELLNEAVLRQRYSAAVRADITVAGSSGDVVYAGSFDGRIWVSFDGGQTFPAPPWQAGGPVERIFVDAAEPRVALAALGGEQGPHVLRTTNSGNFWDPLDGNLPDPRRTASPPIARRARFMWPPTRVFSLPASIWKMPPGRTRWSG